MSNSELKLKLKRYKAQIFSQQKSIVKQKEKVKELELINDGLRGDLEDCKKSLDVEVCFQSNSSKVKVATFFSGVFVASLLIFIGQAVL